MRSLESSHRRDLDQVDPEHLDKISQESSWDDLKNVPFAGNQPTPDINDVLKNMEDVGSFGAKARDSKTSSKEYSANTKADPSDLSPLDISETF